MYIFRSSLETAYITNLILISISTCLCVFVVNDLFVLYHYVKENAQIWVFLYCFEHFMRNLMEINLHVSTWTIKKPHESTPSYKSHA